MGNRRSSNLIKTVGEWFYRDSTLVMILAALFAVSCIAVLTPRVQTNDDIGYYAQTRSFIVGQDLDLEEAYHYYRNQQRVFNSIKQDPVTGIYYSQYPIGVSVLQAPFIYFAHVLAILFGQDTSGYSNGYIFLAGLSSAIYGFSGLLLMFFLLKILFKAFCAFTVTLSFFLASALYFYMFLQPAVSHSYAFFTASGFIFLWINTLNSNGRFDIMNGLSRSRAAFFGLGMTGGLMALVRYQDVCLILVLVMEFVLIAVALWRRHQAGRIIPAVMNYLVAFAGFIVVLSIQAMLLYYQHRTIIPIDYYNGAFDFSRTLKTIPGILFGPNHGLFYWHPLMLAGGIGLVTGFFSKDSFLKSVCFASMTALAAATIITASWGENAYGAQSFGHRFYISCYPLLALGTGILMEKARSGFTKRYGETLIPYYWSILGVILLFVGWNFSLMIQYGARMISTDGPVLLSEMAVNTFHVLPEEIAGIVKKFLFDRDFFH